jgi:hypothetical protein
VAAVHFVTVSSVSLWTGLFSTIYIATTFSVARQDGLKNPQVCDIFLANQMRCVAITLC